MDDFVVFDAETLPALSADDQKYITGKITAPGNYKKPEAIEKYLSDPVNHDEAIRKTSFSGALGTLYCIGFCVGDREPDCLYGTEQKICEDFDKLTKNKDKKTRKRLIGYNSNAFDIPFISQRMWKYGLRPLVDPTLPPYRWHTIDLYSYFTLGNRDKMKLEHVCRCLGIPSPKDGIDGSQVYDAYLEGRHQQVYDYAMRDAAVTREVYYRLSFDGRAVTKAAA